jgi:signal transduction histidine kinase
MINIKGIPVKGAACVRHGFAHALQFLAQGVAGRTGLPIRVDSALDGRLTPAVEMGLYRIMQEGLTNTAKHAGATHVDLQLWRDARGVGEAASASPRPPWPGTSARLFRD